MAGVSCREERFLKEKALENQRTGKASGCSETDTGSEFLMLQISMLFLRCFEIPLPAFVFGENHRRDVIPARVETHVAGDSVVFVDVAQNVLDPVTVRAGFFDSINQHSGAIVTVAGVGIGFQMVFILEFF